MSVCSHCKGWGHNRRTCPHRSNEAKAARLQRLRESREYRKEMYGPTTRKPVTCSQCGETGHNRKTCSEYKRLERLGKDLIPRQAELYRKLMTKNGITPGALVVTKQNCKLVDQRWSHKTDEPIEIVYQIESIEWSMLNVHRLQETTQSQIVKLRRLGSSEITAKSEACGPGLWKVQVNDTAYMRVNLNSLAGLSIENAKEACGSDYMYQDYWQNGLQTPEMIENVMSEWELLIRENKWAEEHEINQRVETLRNILTKRTVVTDGCLPIKKLSADERKELTSGRKLDNIRVDGEEKQPYDKRKLEQIQSYVEYLENRV